MPARFPAMKSLYSKWPIANDTHCGIHSLLRTFGRNDPTARSFRMFGPGRPPGGGPEFLCRRSLELLADDDQSFGPVDLVPRPPATCILGTVFLSASSSTSTTRWPAQIDPLPFSANSRQGVSRRRPRGSASVPKADQGPDDGQSLRPFSSARRSKKRSRRRKNFIIPSPEVRESEAAPLPTTVPKLSAPARLLASFRRTSGTGRTR